jgi:hypothetical protein
VFYLLAYGCESPDRARVDLPLSQPFMSEDAADDLALDAAMSQLMGQLHMSGNTSLESIFDALRAWYPGNPDLQAATAAPAASAGLAGPSLASSAALVAQQQAAALMASVAAGSTLQQATNGNLEQLVPGATQAAANLLISGVVPPAGVSSVAVSGAAATRPVYRFASVTPRGLYGSLRGAGPVVPAQFVPSLDGSVVSSLESAC